MDNNNKNNQNNNKNKKNVNGLLILVIWAVGLTVVFNYLSAYSRQANSAASTHEILYTELLDMVDAGQVERVLLVDDVVTTGSTMAAAAEALRAGGAASVVCAALAAPDQGANQGDHAVQGGNFENKP